MMKNAESKLKISSQTSLYFISLHKQTKKLAIFISSYYTLYNALYQRRNIDLPQIRFVTF